MSQGACCAGIQGRSANPVHLVQRLRVREEQDEHAACLTDGDEADVGRASPDRAPRFSGVDAEVVRGGADVRDGGDVLLVGVEMLDQERHVGVQALDLLRRTIQS